jgi:DNA-binding Lrp family transcriptional regulator
VPFKPERPLSAYENCAIEEFPTDSGPADYALCAGGQILGVVEAKKLTLGPQEVLMQAERYSRGMTSNPFDFNGFHVPFLYSTNGEVIWHHDVRHSLNRSHQVDAFHTPEALREYAARDTEAATDALLARPNDHPRLRPYQREANAAIEQAITNRKRQMLVAMATGTGKTFTMVNEVYRLMKSGVAKRILFLVDRRALAAQAVRAFASFEPEPNQKFDKIYEVYNQETRREVMTAKARTRPAYDAQTTADDLPEGWAAATLGDISERIQYGYTASATQTKGPRFLRITDIQDGKVDWASVPSCEISKDDAEKYALVPGDIVFARTGATTGKSFLILSCPPAVFASYLIRVRTHELVKPSFLSHYFDTPQYWEFISENIAGNAQPNCNATKLPALPVAIPPLFEQVRITAKLEALRTCVNASRAHLAKARLILKRFRQAALAAACSGRLTEDWREKHRDVEPARNLIARIRVDRRTEWKSMELAKIRSQGGTQRTDRRKREYTGPENPEVNDAPELPDTWCYTGIEILLSTTRRGIKTGPLEAR